MGGQNKPGPSGRTSKLDEDTGDYHVDRVTHDFARALQKARMEKGLSQADLAKAVDEKTSVVADYESGRAIPNGRVVARLKKVLGADLPPARPKKKERPTEQEE